VAVTPIEINDLSTLYHWGTALLLVSLDRVTPFWGEMGLHFSDPARAKAVVRRFVLEQQELTMIGGPAYAAQVSERLTCMFADLAALEGKANAGRLRDWIEQRYVRFQLPEEAWRDAWKSLLTWIDASQEPLLAELGIPEEKARSLVDLSDQWSRLSDALEEQIEEADSESLEGWDGEQYRLYQRETPVISPLDSLSNYLSTSRFTGIWGEILRVLSRPQRDALNDWGQLICATYTTIAPARALIPAHYRGTS
jgi:hypothetical protein